MRLYLVITALILNMCTSVYADQTPLILASDSRIKKFVYDENTVYKLDLYLKAITSVQFASGEQIQSILVGDSASWEIVKLKSGNVVSIKPIALNALTDMTVYTDRHVYTFELRSVGTIKPGRKSAANQTYRSKFIYPEDEKKGKVSEEVAVKNYDYLAAGKSKFKPVQVYDNGKQTFFVFPENAPKPAIFKVNRKGRESLVNVRTKENTIIVDSVNDYWTVRIGDEYVCVGAGSVVKPSLGSLLTNGK
jgi:type IV secretion system protein VirB9